MSNQRLRRNPYLFAVFVITFAAASTIAQPGTESESQRLTKSAFALFQEGKVDQAVSIADQVVSIENNKPNPNQQNLAAALLNLARLKKEHYWILRKDLAEPNISREAHIASDAKRRNYSNEIVALLKQVIEIYETKIKTDSDQLALAKFELAQFADRVGNFVLVSRGKGDGAEQIQTLYTEALVMRQKLLGDSDDLTIYTMFSLAAFVDSRAEIEKSLPLYENYVKLVEAKHGSSSKYLLSAFRALGRLYVTISDQIKADEIKARIEAVTGQAEAAPQADMDLTRRSKTDFLAKLMADPSTISLGTKLQRSLVVQVEIDEKGKVVHLSVPDTGERDMFGDSIRRKALKDVKNWEFRPLTVHDVKKRMKGVVWYPYFVKIKD